MVNEVLGPPARKSVPQSESDTRTAHHKCQLSLPSLRYESVNEYQVLLGRLVAND